MKKLVAISILAAMLLAIGAVAMATETDWLLLMKAQTSAGTLASGIAQLGTATGATDGYESTKDGVVAFVNTNAGLGIYEPTWTASTPPLYGKDNKAPIVGEQTKTWDLVLFAGTSYGGADLKLIWWNSAGTSTQDIPVTIGGLAATYTLEVIADPTQTYAAGTKFVFDPAAAATTSTAPAGSMVWSSAALASLKFAPDAAVAGGIQLRFTASTVQTVIPEPSSLLALASGLAGLGGFAIRRRRA